MESTEIATGVQISATSGGLKPFLPNTYIYRDHKAF